MYGKILREFKNVNTTNIKTMEANIDNIITVLKLNENDVKEGDLEWYFCVKESPNTDRSPRVKGNVIMLFDAIKSKFPVKMVPIPHLRVWNMVSVTKDGWNTIEHFFRNSEEYRKAMIVGIECGCT
jgi:hypothetical protein